MWFPARLNFEYVSNTLAWLNRSTLECTKYHFWIVNECKDLDNLDWIEYKEGYMGIHPTLRKYSVGRI